MLGFAFGLWESESMKSTSSAIILASGLVAFGSVWAGPVAELDPVTFEWGRQIENRGEYAFTFKVKNSGDEELQITRVRPGCSCTKVELKKQNLAPGESTEMTGVLTTKGAEGAVHKGILLTTNEPNRETLVASLSVRFPLKGTGLRLKGTTAIPARLRDNVLWAYPLVENCEPETTIQVQAMELPAGWECQRPLPYSVKPEERATLPLMRKLGAGEVVEALESLPFTLSTDFAQTARLQGAISYHPERPAATVQAVGGDGTGENRPPVRWPVAKPESAMAPITAPPPSGAVASPAAPTVPAAAATGGAAPTPAP